MTKRKYSTVKEWNSAVKDKKVTSMTEQVRRLEIMRMDILLDNGPKSKEVWSVEKLLKLKNKRIEKGYL